jgi:hypothetical protein
MIKEEELMNLRTQNQDLQEQLAALKVSAAYVHEVC